MTGYKPLTVGYAHGYLNLTIGDQTVSLGAVSIPLTTQPYRSDTEESAVMSIAADLREVRDIAETVVDALIKAGLIEDAS